MLVKEELINFMIAGHIHLSRQDYLFFSNLEKISKNKQVTTGQDKLFDKLLDKYSRQIYKINLDVKTLKSLPWRSPLLQTTEQYQTADLSLKNNQLVLKSPFNKGFNTALKDLRDQNTFIWDRENRSHISPATTLALKNITQLLPKYFKTYHYCDQIKKLFDDIEVYKDYIYDPTLVSRAGNLYVIGCSEALYSQLKDINLHIDSVTFTKLSQLGVTISPELMSTKELKFAGEFFNDVDIDDLDEVSLWVKNLGFNSVVVGHNLVYTRSLYKEIKSKLEENNISVVLNNTLEKTLNNRENINKYIFLQLNSNQRDSNFAETATKVIFIKSKRPVIVDGLKTTSSLFK